MHNTTFDFLQLLFYQTNPHVPYIIWKVLISSISITEKLMAYWVFHIKIWEQAYFVNKTINKD